jgi:hypothetical protein
MRIAVFANRADSGSYYRAFEPMHALGQRGHTVYLGDADAHLPPDVRPEVVHIARSATQEMRKLVARVHDAGGAVTWDLDDAVHLGPTLSRGGLSTQNMRSLTVTMLRRADVVTTTSHPLADEFRALGAACVHPIENFLGPHYENLRRPTHQGLLLGWAAFAEHQQDYRVLELRATLLRLLDEHPELRVETIGALDLGLPGDRYVRRKPVPFTELGREVARFDIAIAPIADIPFNRVRSNIKLKEYAAGGVPWLASPIGPYSGLGEKQGGRLVADDRWYEELRQLITSERLRRKLAKRGRRWAGTQMLADNTGPWEAALQEAIKRARARPR